MLSGKPQAFHGLIEYYLKGPEKEKNLDQALALAEEALSLDPDDVPSLIQKADVLAEKGQLPEAENLYRLASRKRPGYTQCYTRLIDLYGKADLFEKKENEQSNLLEIVVQLEPETGFLTRTDLGGIYQQQGENYYQKAEELHRAAIDAYSEGLVAPLNLGYFFLDYQKQLEKAAAIFEAVQQRIPDAWESYLAMARLHEAQENWEAALEQYKQVEQLIPSWERFMQATIGRCFRQLGQYDAAEKALLRAWKLDNYDDSGALAELYELAQKFYKNTENPQAEKAVKLLGRAIKARDNAPKAVAGIVNRQGHVHYYLENYGEALPYYQKAADLEPKESVYFTNQFDCLEKLYRQAPDEALFELALKALNNAATLAPKDFSISKKRRQLALIRYNPHLATLPTLYQVHVEVGQPLLSQITTDFESLQPEMMALTDALRTRMKERFAINLPGLRYRDISDGDGVYQFRLYETPVWLDRLKLAENKPPTMAAVLEQLEQFITNYSLDLFINYWDVDSEVPLLPNAELVHFTRVVMALLAEQTPLVPLPEIHQQYRRLGGTNLSVATAVEELRVWEKLRIKLPGVQANYQYIPLGEQEEQLLERFLSGEGNTRVLALPLTYTRSFLGAIIRKIQAHDQQEIALVTNQQNLRPYLRSVLLTLPQIPILKTTELPADAAERYLSPLAIDDRDDSLFLQTFQDLQSNISPDNNPTKT
jgi:tetratricopeptide (TPR) repeat protein